MSSIRLRVPHVGEERPSRAYRLAGCRLLATAPLLWLAPFEESGEAAFRREVPGTTREGGNDGTTARLGEVRPEERPCIYRGPGELGGALRQVECRWDRGAYRLEIAGAGVFAVAAGGSRIRCLEIDPALTSEELAEILLGPALLLALAQRGIFCLHAAAVATGTRAVAFAGVSGAGKSTLAAALALRPPFRRLSDDLLPVTLGDAGAVALPRFPQLKLPAAEQPAGEAERLDLAAVFLLEGAPRGAARAAVSSSPLSRGQGTLALVAQTAAARLFAPPLLASHLRFCGALAARIPVRRLAYPWRSDALPRIAEEIGRDLGMA